MIARRPPRTPPCLTLRRPAGDTDPHVIVALNLGSDPAVVAAHEVILASGADPTPTEGGFVLAPDSAAWLR